MAEINGSWGTPPPPPPRGFDGSSFGQSMQHDDLARFWRRFVAHVCDGLNTMLVLIPFSFVSSALNDNGQAEVSALVSLTGVAVSVYMLAKWTGERGGTPLRVRYGVLVVDQRDGSFIGSRRAFWRILMSYVSQVVFLLGYLWMIWDKDNQTWHDKVANSVVVNRR